MGARLRSCSRIACRVRVHSLRHQGAAAASAAERPAARALGSCRPASAQLPEGCAGQAVQLRRCLGSLRAQSLQRPTSSVRGGTPWSSGGTRTPPVPPWLFADILAVQERPQAPQRAAHFERESPPWHRGLKHPCVTELLLAARKKEWGVPPGVADRLF